MLKPTNVLRTFIKKNTVSTMTDRQSAAIIIVLKGAFNFQFSDKRIICNKQCGIFIPQNESYTHICTEDAESIMFNLKTAENNLRPFPIINMNNETAEELFKQIEEIEFNDINCENLRYSLYYKMLSEIFDDRRYLSTLEEYVNSAQRIIINGISKKSLTCKSVASEIGISEVYLRKLFIKFKGISPSKYIMKQRMTKAKIYLANGYRVNECATAVGYSDIYQFSRAYKKYHGYSPSKGLL